MMDQRKRKADEKRKLRKERQVAIVAAQKLVQAANEQEDPLANLQPFTRFDRNGLKLNIECKRSVDLSCATRLWAFELTKTNMKSLYEVSGWRWSDRDKRNELEDVSARYLVVRTDESKPIAFVHFRYDMDDAIHVVYCYEIQLTESVRGKGLGKMLMQILELLAFQARMKKVMLTVFNANSGAKKFFMENLKYTIDETSPSICDADVQATYEILSKPIGRK